MNSDIIPQGPSELITGPATIDRLVLVCEATDACVVDNVVTQFPAAPPNSAAVDAATLPVNGRLYNLKSLTLTSGTLFVVYRY